MTANSGLSDSRSEEMDTNITKSDWQLLIIIFLNGVKLIYQLRTLKKQLKNGEITKENLEISSATTTLLKLDRYVSEFLQKLKNKF